jgi:UDP-N-acetylglucosamine 3-dehydrogenase
MSKLRVGIIGCGRPWKSEGSTGFGMSRSHARGYLASGEAELVALADINLDNARVFQNDIGGERLYADYREMLRMEKPDIVSISTWPRLHAEMVIAAAQAGAKAIHCEKPMAPTYGESRRMVEVCERHGAQLTFNHQRRFGNLFRKARGLLKSGAVGHLVRLEAACPNLFDWGSHWFDMLFFFNDETPVEWVIGQIERRGGHEAFGVPVEGQGVSHFLFKNGVLGAVFCGFQSGGDCWIRIHGKDGAIEISLSSKPNLRVWGKGQTDWQAIDVLPERSDLDEPVTLGVLDLMEALKTGREPELSARRALRATEVIFATYESSRRRGRVDLPLDIEDSPLLALLAET